MRTKTIKCLDKNIEENLSDLGLSKLFLNRTKLSYNCKIKFNKLVLVKIKNVRYSKVTLKKIKW